MNRLILFTAISMAAASTASAQTVAATWSSFDNVGDQTSGMLGPIAFTGTLLKDAQSQTFTSLNQFEFAAAPLSNLEEFVEYRTRSPFKFVFSHPIKGLRLYLINWRESSYDLDQPFTVISGLSSVLSVGNPIECPAGFNNGVIQFDTPVSTVNLTSSSLTDTFQGVHFAVVLEPTTLAISGPLKIRTSRPSVTLRGTASATFSVEKVSVKAGKGAAKTATGREQWSIRLRPDIGRTTVSINASAFGGATSATTKVKILRR